MQKRYRILSLQAADIQGRVIYTLLPISGAEKSLRIVVNHQSTWYVDGLVLLDDAFVEANREI